MFFGAHLSTSGGIDMAVDRAVDIGAEGVQVFVSSPRMWRQTAPRPENIERFREQRDLHLKGAVAHASYLINVASPDDELWEKSTAALEQTMEVGELLGLDAVIFHPGSHKGAESGLGGCIDRLARAIDRVLTKSESTWLLLENSAGQGGTIGRDTDELCQLVEACDRHPRLGVCLDTCHWFVSGIDVRDPAVLDRELDELDQAVGLDRLRALHINDSKAPLGSNRDRHDNIGVGLIGDGLSTFLGNPRLQGIGAYLEVPGEGKGPTSSEVDAVRRLHAAGVKAAARSVRAPR